MADPRADCLAPPLIEAAEDLRRSAEPVGRAGEVPRACCRLGLEWRGPPRGPVPPARALRGGEIQHRPRGPSRPAVNFVLPGPNRRAHRSAGSRTWRAPACGLVRRRRRCASSVVPPPRAAAARRVADRLPRRASRDLGRRGSVRPGRHRAFTWRYRFAAIKSAEPDPQAVFAGAGCWARRRRSPQAFQQSAGACCRRVLPLHRADTTGGAAIRRTGSTSSRPAEYAAVRRIGAMSWAETCRDASCSRDCWRIMDGSSGRTTPAPALRLRPPLPRMLVASATRRLRWPGGHARCRRGLLWCWRWLAAVQRRAARAAAPPAGVLGSSPATCGAKSFAAALRDIDTDRVHRHRDRGDGAGERAGARRLRQRRRAAARVSGRQRLRQFLLVSSAAVTHSASIRDNLWNDILLWKLRGGASRQRQWHRWYGLRPAGHIRAARAGASSWTQGDASRSAT